MRKIAWNKDPNVLVSKQQFESLNLKKRDAIMGRNGVLDKIDRSLLALLQSNARDSTTNLAIRLGVARTTVHERIARLERTGTIKGYSAVLHNNPFNDYVKCVLMLDIVKQKQPEILQNLKKYPEMKLVWAMNGECDLYCHVELPQLEDLDALLEEVTAIGGITSARSMVVLATKLDRQHHTWTGPSRADTIAISRGEED